MDKKIIFLDVDGTIYAKPGFIPESARKAITQAKENGHVLYLSTGRSRKETPDNVWELGFDGIVGASGAYVEHQNQLIFNEHLPKEDLCELYRFLEEHHVVYTIETNEKLCGTKENIEEQNAYFRVWFEGMKDAEISMQAFDSITEVVKDISEVQDVNKVLFYNAPFPLETVREQFGDRFTVIESSIEHLDGVNAEVYSSKINKATGMEKILEHVGAKREDTIAFGDGSNDFEMLAFAGVGVAMGNGVEALKEIADFVTEEAIADGLYKGFQKLGLI